MEFGCLCFGSFFFFKQKSSYEMRIWDWSSDVCSSDLFRKERIKPVLELAVSRFNAFARLQTELDEARNALADRKAIDRAKALLMRRRGVGEPEIGRA